MPGIEVERKWLIPGAPPPEALDAPAERIDQGYLTIGAGGAETRLRRRAGEFILTVKSGTGLVRNELSVQLSAEQFEALWPATLGARVEKTRHLIPGPDGTEIELDVFDGDLTGLIVAEVEFPDAERATSFVAPDWFGADVTDDARFKNHQLAVHGRPQMGRPEPA